MKLPENLEEWIKDTYGDPKDYDSDQLCRYIGLTDMAQEILTNPLRYGLVPLEQAEKLANGLKEARQNIYYCLNKVKAPDPWMEDGALSCITDYQAWKETNNDK